MRYSIWGLSVLCLFSACSQSPSLPDSYVESTEVLHIQPDYKGVTVPVNIAPLNFQVQGDSIDACVAQVSCSGGAFRCGTGRKVLFNENEWRTMLEAAVNQDIEIQMYTRCNGTWRKHPLFSISVVGDSIDNYVTYRRIPPSYTTYENLSLCQRNLQTFEELEIYNNVMLNKEQGGHCINCHSAQNYRADRWQFHVRADYGGTVIYDQGKWRKVNQKTSQVLSGGAYASWHPTLNLIAYATGKPFQNFNTDDPVKAEVQDEKSGLMLYDVEHNRTLPICDSPDSLESFPTWSPDGQYLYYSSAPSWEGQQASEVRYQLMRRSFDSLQQCFGPAELIYDAVADSMSAILPRLNPADGRSLLYSLSNYGCFHIWHQESDLYLSDLESGATRCLLEASGKGADSYHAWSSNGRWILVASRREDGNYTRLYFSYYDREGRDHKAFQLPQEDPDYEIYNVRSYNVPEFMVDPISITPQEVAKVVRQESIPAQE